MALGITASAPAQATSSPCTTVEHQALDFQSGAWNVHGPAGKLVGTNSIKRAISGCMLRERYVTGRGYSGESFNVYDAPRKVWHQTWVDNGGLLLVLEGGGRDGKMVMQGQTTGADQKVTKHRIS